jgi:nitroreductase
MSGGDAVVRALLERRSIGHVRQEPIAPEVLERCLAAAAHAPNHHGTRPWRFVVISGEARERLGEAHARAVARTDREAGAEAIARQAAKPLRAPVVIACIHRAEATDPVTLREDRDAVAAGIQNLLLAAHAQGLGAMWRTGEMVDEPEVRAHLGVADADAIVGFVYLGRPAGPAPPQPDRPLDGMVEWRGGER